MLSNFTFQAVGSQSKRAQSKHIFARSFEEVGFVCMFACFERSSNTFCCQYLSQNSDSSFLFLRSFVCLPQFISIQSRQTANYLSCYKILIYVSQLFISRMPKMGAIPQLVSAPLNPIPIAEHFRWSHPPCEHSHGQFIS